MSETQDQLREHLRQLEAELARTEPANDAQRKHLQALRDDVQALLTSQEPLTSAAHQSAGQRMRASLQHFESTHPALSSLIEQVLNILSAAGI